MAIQTFKLTTISPMFLNGADTRSPEVRAASVRGHLRYWFRAIEGARTTTLKEVAEAESAVFGSVNYGSMVTVRLFPKDESSLKTSSEVMLPHRAEKRSPQDAIRAGSELTLELVTRPGIKMPRNAYEAAYLWMLLGGIGKRSRRMFGAFKSEKVLPADVTHWAEGIKDRLNKNIDASAQLTMTPAFPTLHSQFSRVIIGMEPFKSAEEANRQLFGLLRSEKYRDRREFGYVEGGRRASPLIAQVRKFGEQYYPVLTAMFSQEPGERMDWTILDNFLKDAMGQWNGVQIWGTQLR